MVGLVPRVCFGSVRKEVWVLGRDSYNQFEVGLIGWCLRNGDQFGGLLKHVRQRFFADPQATTLWPHLLEIWNTYGAWPQEGEALHFLDQRLATNPLRPVLKDYLTACYAATPTEFTGAELKKWVASRELLDLSNKLTDFSATWGSLPAEAAEEALVNLEADFDAALRVVKSEAVEGEDFDPLSDEAIDAAEEDNDEEWGSSLLQTGFVRLDSKFKEGGLRPLPVLIFGPTGVCKTFFSLNIAMYQVAQGKRGVYISFDDPKIDLRDRIWSHMLCREIEVEPLRNAGLLEGVLQELRDVRSEFPGRLILKILDPERYTPTNIIQMLEDLRTKFSAEDAAAGKPEEEWGKLDFVVVDTSDQLAPDRRYKSEWYEIGKMHQTLCMIPKRFGAVLFSIIQAGQQTVGAAQLTERDVGEAYAKTKPYKLILGVCQTAVQYHTSSPIPVADSMIQCNWHNLHNYSPELDRDTLWTPFNLCLIKNSRASSRTGTANKVKIPMLINYGSCRILEDFTSPLTPLTSPAQTQREAAEAESPTPMINRKRKVRK